ncbi:MAG: ATP-dependent sacrificial sulfur transferase LarE [Bacteroidales bacterium]|nr:ATP-dependent sacrificial sulfur transferase LarE [Bacteroidales bacterium]
MEKELKKKYAALKNYLKKLEEIVVAFSGGVDSTLLLKISNDITGLKVYALIGKSYSTPQAEFLYAMEMAQQIGVNPIVVETNELNSPDYCNNALDRCYRCKKIIFGTFISYMHEFGLRNLADGSNYDDLSDFRPGNKALEEFGVISPFKEFGFTKGNIRELSKELKLPSWNKEALSCLATRISYGEPITREKLLKIEHAETYLRELGFSSVRARLHGDQLRIESSSEQLHRFFEENTRQRIIEKMKGIGFKYISVDMEGYRMGSMNQ